MKPSEYIEEALSTKSDKFYAPILIETPADVDALHAAMGIATEAGEFLDPFKKAYFYGKPIDFTNLDEEVGDLLWYIAIYLNARSLSFENVMQRNINKLRTRYPEKFKAADAINRDLNAERAVLEQQPFDGTGTLTHEED